MDAAECALWVMIAEPQNNSSIVALKWKPFPGFGTALEVLVGAFGVFQPITSETPH